MDTILLGRRVSLELYSIDGSGVQVVDTTFVDGSSATVHFLDASAAEHGFGVRWEYSGDATSFGSDPADPLCVDFGGPCVPLPDVAGRIGDGSVSGTLAVRVYETEAATAVEVLIESTATSGHQGASFTSAVPENQVSHTGSVTPAELTPTLAWSVEILTPRNALVVAPPGGTGVTFDWVVPPQTAARYAGYTHEDAIAALGGSGPLANALRFGVTLTASDGGESYESEPVIVAQDEIDTIRQEYLDYMASAGLPRVPARIEFEPNTPCEIICENNGDFDFAIVDGVFLTGLNDLRAAWPAQWQLNVTYRNPVHQNVHLGSVGNSWHQYGCAADLQTFPVPRNTEADEDAAAVFWSALARLARRMDFEVEALDDSGVGHVHVEIDCPQPLQ